MAGDFDLVLTANTGRLKNVMGNKNFYVEDADFSAARQLTKIEKEQKLMEQSFQSWLPFVNYTEMAADIDDLYQKKGVEPPVGLFPRWFA